ncbi:MAG: hypothetical protein AAF411_07555 [Myxococcota bacterium]
MSRDRLFLSQETLDMWLVDERVTVEGDVMSLLGTERKFRLKSAVHFVADVTETGDPHHVLGRVKDVEVLAEAGGEHVSDSVIWGDTAYEVVEGFIGEPEAGGSEETLADDIAALFGEKG